MEVEARGRDTMDNWTHHIADLHDLMTRLSCRRGRAQNIGVEPAFDLWRRLTLTLRRQRRTVYLVGNGASASMASHMAADLAKNARLHTEVFSDLSLITAISNDLGYDQVFSEPLSRRARSGDMLVAISSPGRSLNVLKAVDVARRSRLTIVTLSAMDPDNPLRSLGTLNLYTPALTYGCAETCHAAALHHWMDLVDVTVRGGTKRPGRMRP